MGYLVKASFNAEPRAYSLEGIKTDVATGLLTPSAMVREEQDDSWHSVAELIGEEPKDKQVAGVSDIEARLQKAKLLMLLGAMYAAVGIPVAVLNLILGAPTGGLSHITFIGLTLIGLVTFYQGWRQSSQLRHQTLQDRN